MGDAEPMEFRFESSSAFRRRMRRRIKKARIHVAAMARNPKITMTAIAQCGKPGPFAADWTFPVAVGAPAVPVANLEADADEAAAAIDAEEMEADEAAIEEATESAKVVSA